MRKKPCIAIITARNLKTSSDCSPETVLNLLNVIDINNFKIDLIFVDEFIPLELRVTENELLDLPMYVPFSEVEKHPKLSETYRLADFTFAEFRQRYQMAIVAIYNDLGEDGKILGMLDLLGIPYLSPSLKVSAVCFDKSYTKALLNYAGVSNPEGFLVSHDKCSIDWINNEVVKKFNYPVMLKAVSSGNSWGVNKVTNEMELPQAIANALKYSDEILVERFIEGQEFTVGVVGDYTKPLALPVVQINTRNEFFDYVAKYTSGKTDEQCPALIKPELEEKLRSVAIRAYQAVKANSHARIDILLSKDETPYVLDINTFPGLNTASLFPKELLVSGTTLDQFVNSEIQKKYRRDGDNNKK